MDTDNAVIQLTPIDSIVSGKRVSNTKLPKSITISNGEIRRNVDHEPIALHKKRRL
ncbi:hypothetical protein [Teredinibacter haidensis]|uniref:hypothetical protein n=1 Tax=Teredinibacter haidensis TaxID=2731755 RepID=UPI00158808ED|nr:hypothetical protein [Teredinibacter haidensis]